MLFNFDSLNYIAKYLVRPHLVGGARVRAPGRQGVVLKDGGRLQTEPIVHYEYMALAKKTSVLREVMLSFLSHGVLV